MLRGFRNFLLRASLIDLAIAVVIGVAFGTLIDAIVADLITPLIAALGGRPDFAGLMFRVNHSTFRYGALVNAILAFLIVAATVYFFVVLPVNKFLERTRAEKDITTRDCPECLGRIPAAARKCMFCASEVPPTIIGEMGAPILPGN